jgi:hypothetical protein
MCMAHEIRCNCGRSMAGFNFKDELMSEEIIAGIYCPGCSRDIRFDPETMFADNGWIIVYDMDIARFQAQSIKSGSAGVTPSFIFDEGYCTWRGMYPTDHIDCVAERAEIVKLSRIDTTRYLEELKAWAHARMERLLQEGWRKAHAADKAGF